MKPTLCLLIIACLFLNRSASAQVNLSNAGTLFVSSGADTLFINGDLNNASTAGLTNNGRLIVKQALINHQASMAAGTGSLFLNGSTMQTVSGTQPFKTFDFVSDNAAGIILNNNVSVSGVHNFNNGIITTSATPNYLVYESGSSYNGDGDAAHVDGWVKKIGSSNFVFPVGNGTVERTVALSGLTASSEFNAKYLANTPNVTLMQSPIFEIDPAEYWSINKVSGGNASVTLNWDYSKVYFPNWIVPDIRVAGWNGSLWVTNGGTASGTAHTTGTITSNSVSSFNLFAFGSQSYILPLNLISFTAQREEDITQISWITSNEINVKRYLAERSDDNVQFYSIAELPARNSGNTEIYTIRDNKAINGMAYYRLRCIDNDGKEKISRIVTVTDERTAGKLLLVSNPVHGNIVLAASGRISGDFEYQVNAMNGQLIQNGRLSVTNAGQYQITLNNKLRAGTYSLRLTGRTQSFYFKLLIL